MRGLLLEPFGDCDPEPDELDVCHHGVGFDEECWRCELEMEDDEDGEMGCELVKRENA